MVACPVALVYAKLAQRGNWDVQAQLYSSWPGSNSERDIRLGSFNVL